jgi:hypothetical protein
MSCTHRLVTAATPAPQAVITELGKQKLEAIKADLDVDVVAAGGWNSVQKLAADPKGALVNMIVSSLRTNGGMVGNVIDDGKLDGILALLAAQGKGFSSDLVDGEWVSVLDKSGKKSPKIQKAVAKKETAGKSFANFDVKASKFSGSVMLGKRSEVRSTVSYTPVGTGYTKVGKTIVVRRIMCDIVGANVKIWRFPRVPVPLRSKGGYLDFIYMDEDIRITKGNRGGLFVHFRPAFLEKVM